MPPLPGLASRQLQEQLGLVGQGIARVLFTVNDGVMEDCSAALADLREE
jgi:hypothetical protein